jgi:hypothetical protein
MVMKLKLGESFDEVEIARIVKDSEKYDMLLHINKYWNSDTGWQKSYDITVGGFDESGECVETYFPSALYEHPVMAHAMAHTFAAEMALRDVYLGEQWEVMVWDMHKEDPVVGGSSACPSCISQTELLETFYSIEDDAAPVPEKGTPELSIV